MRRTFMDIYLFRSVRRCFQVICIIGTFVIMWVLITKKHYSRANFRVLSMLFILACALFMPMVSAIKYKRLLKILNARCNPQAFLAVCFKSANLNDIRIRINMVTAYLCLGDYAAAQQLQHNVFNLLNQPALKASDFYLFHHNNFVLFLRQNRLAEAGAELKVMQAMASERYMPYRLVVQYDQSNRARQYELNVAYGLYDGAAQFFQTNFEQEPYNIRKIAIMLILAKIYIHDKQWDAARAALDYVLQNGSKTVYAAEAASLLLTLNV